MYKGSTGAEHLVLGPEEKNVRALHHLNETHVRKKIIIIERKKERKKKYVQNVHETRFAVKT
jgi:hypothetical protein